MLTIDEYRRLGLALREAQRAEDHAEARRIENQLASAPRAIRRIYLGEVPPRRPDDEQPIRPAFLEELLAQAGPIPVSDEDFAQANSSSGLRSGTDVSGAQLGGFRLLERIGEGALGTVWLAEHTVLLRRAAIKVLNSSFTSRPDIVGRLFHEARAATAISDPGIAQIYDVGHHVDGTAYIAMEYLDGEPLDRRLRRLGRLRLPDALRIVGQVASTLGVAHRHGLVHRDLEPGNIFLVPDPKMIGGERAKILDFGIAKLTSAPGTRTLAGTLLVTTAYLPPEQCRGGSHVDQRSDVYALGCMLFALVTGAPPFLGTALESLMMHVHEPPPLLSSRVPGIPPEIDALVQRCLAKDPASRFHSGTELAAEISWVLARHTAPSLLAARSASGVPEHVGSGTTLSVASGAAPTSWARRSSPNRVFALIAAVIAAGILAVAVPLAERGPTVSTPPTQAPPSMPPPPSALPPSDDPLSTVRLAVHKASEVAAEALQTSEAIGAQAAELSAAIATRPQDDATLTRVAALRDALEAAHHRLDTAAARVETAVLEASTLAGASAAGDVKKLVEEAERTAQGARSATTSARSQVIAAVAAAGRLLESAPPR